MGNHDLIKRAKTFCEVNKYRFTVPRERVLALLATTNEPMGAYQIRESLSSDAEKISPPTIYRAIEFWSEHRFVHRIESMNAYIACSEHQDHENFCIFICDDCQAVLELTMKDLPETIPTEIGNNHLTITHSTTEIHGKCNQCG